MSFIDVVLLISRDEELVILYTILPVASSTVSNLLVGSILLVDVALIILFFRPHTLCEGIINYCSST